MKTVSHICLFISMMTLGCAVFHSNDPRPVAEDPVCLYNRDYGCFRVRIDENTPREKYAGKDYYFCNESCREVFLADPEKYTQ